MLVLYCAYEKDDKKIGIIISHRDGISSVSGTLSGGSRQRDLSGSLCGSGR